MLGRVVGKYRLLDQIGEGGMGVVYRAEHTVLGSPAAVKVLLPQWTMDEVVVDRFFHEAKAASAIHHVGIVDVFDFGRLENEQAWIAMEYLQGESLTQLVMRSGGRLDPAIAQIIAQQILAALDAAHITGVIHRDLKPDNVVLVRDPSAPGAIRVKLLDFGIAKLGTDRFGAKKETKGGTILGTPTYMAPEQCRSLKDVDARCDLYALGVMLFEMLAGRPPFFAETGIGVVRMHLEEPPPRLSQYAHVPQELDALVAKLLVKDPDDRVPSAAYALAALERISLPPFGGDIAVMSGAMPIGMHTVYLPHPLGEPPPSKRFPIIVIAVAVVVAVAALLAIGLA
ncbi:MAG: serine/threonine-protein kinase [Kofleriaceae bacterium]